MANRSWMTRLLLSTLLLSILLSQGCSDSKSVAPEGPLLALSQTSLDFSTAAGDVPDPAARQVTVSNAGTGVLTFDVTTSSPWLELGPITSTDFFITVRSETLATGVYQDTVWVTSDEADNSPQRVLVNLVVVEQLAATPDSVFFAAVSGGQTPDVQYVQLEPIGGIDIAFSATAATSWITVTDEAGVTPDSIGVTVDITGLSGGIYTSKINVTSADAPEMELEVAIRLALSSWLKRQPYDSAASASFELRGVTFVDELHGWAVGFLPDLSDPEGAFFYTTNGGESWTRSSVTPRGKYEAVAFINTDRGFVTGDSGRLVVSNNGGITWYPVSGFPLDSTANLIDITFVGSDSGWIVGTNGAILATADSGTTWATQTSPVDDDLYSIWFVDALHGWICGNQGTILSTDDGGQTWSEQSSGITSDLRGISFGNTSTGWAAGGQGKILHTGNGGASWQIIDAGISSPLLDVYFVSPTTGWIVGDGGVIFRTVDGGTSWEQQLSETSQSLFHVHFSNENFGVVVGSRGMILKTIGGGF